MTKEQLMESKVTAWCFEDHSDFTPHPDLRKKLYEVWDQCRGVEGTHLVKDEKVYKYTEEEGVYTLHESKMSPDAFYLLRSFELERDFNPYANNAGFEIWYDTNMEEAREIPPELFKYLDLVLALSGRERDART